MRTRKTILFNSLAMLACGLIIVTGTLFADRTADSADGLGELPAVPTEGRGVSTYDNAIGYDDGECDYVLGNGWPFMHFDAIAGCTSSLNITGVWAAHVSNVSTPPPIDMVTIQTGVTAPAAIGSGSASGLTTPIQKIGDYCATAGAPAWSALDTPVPLTASQDFFIGLFQGSTASPQYVSLGGDSDNPVGRAWWAASWGAYSPAALSSLVTNWMMRVTVDGPGCVPVELMSFSIE